MGSLFHTHECLMKSGVETQKRLESHPATKKMRILQRPRSASLGEATKSQTKGEKRAVPSPPLERTPKRGKGGQSSPSYAQVTMIQTPNKEGDWQVVKNRGKKNKKTKKQKYIGEKGEGPCTKSAGNCCQTEIEALHALQVGRCHQDVSKGRPVLRRDLERDECESRPLEVRT